VNIGKLDCPSPNATQQSSFKNRPEDFLAKTELCRLAYSLLSDEVKLIIANEMNLPENDHPKHEVNLAEMLSLISIFKETRASRIISKMNITSYSGNMKSLIVLEVGKMKKVMPRLSQYTPESCAAYLLSPLITEEPRPEVIKTYKRKPKPVGNNDADGNFHGSRYSSPFLSSSSKTASLNSPRSTFEYTDDYSTGSQTDEDLDVFTQKPISSQLLYEKLAIMRELKRFRQWEYQDDNNEDDNEGEDYSYSTMPR
jgi:hypothetical protein